MKTCSKCKTEKTVTYFQKDTRTKDGLRSACKECVNAATRSYRDANPEKIAEQKKRYWAKSSEAEKPKRKERYEKNKDIETENARAYYHANKGACQAKHREWLVNNREAVLAQSAVYRSENKEKISAYAKKNSVKILARVNGRRAKKLNATPPWVDLKEIEDIYQEARLESERTGIVMHVDHIVPLVSDIVCGLHVPWNLEVMTGKANQSKGNRTWPDMP